VGKRQADANDGRATLWRPSPEEQIDAVSDQVQALIDEGALNGGQGKGLTQLLENARKRLATGQTTAACNQLQAFIHQVKAKLDEADGQPLIDAAHNLMDQFCG
jgi:hypothetical protein